MIDAELEICPGYGWQGGPVFATRVVTLKSGEERRNASAAYARHQYALPINNIRGGKYLEDLKALFMVVRGQQNAFLAKDFSDFKYTSDPFAIGDGTTKEFQIGRVYVFGGHTYTHPTYYPASGVVVTAGAATATVSGGTATFASPPGIGDPVVASGEYRIPVRFASDSLQMVIDNMFSGTNEYAMTGSINLVEVFP